MMRLSLCSFTAVCVRGELCCAAAVVGIVPDECSGECECLSFLDVVLRCVLKVVESPQGSWRPRFFSCQYS